MASLNDKVVFITGGARGVGAEVARRLRARGAKLVLTDLDVAPLTALAAELGGDEHVLTVVADVCDLAAMQAAAAQAIEKFGGIDVVLANAGIATYGSVLNVDPVAFKRLLDINVLGVFHTVRATLPAVIERRGYILISSSLAAYAPCPGLASYNASKAGVEHFASALRQEVAYLGVAVGSAHMSWIDTPLVQDAKSDLPSFRTMLSKMPYPLNRTTSVSQCGAAFVKGIEGRKTRVNCPGWVEVFRWVKPLLSTALVERELEKNVPELMPQLDAEVAAMGRSLSARIDSLGKA